MEGILIVAGVTLLIFGAVALLGIGFAGGIQSNHNIIAARIQMLKGRAPGEKEDRGAASADKKKTESPLSRVASKIGARARKYFEGGGDETAHKLAMAGFNSPSHIGTYHGIRLLFASGASCVSGIMALVSGAPAGKIVLAAVVALLVGMLLPNLWLSMQIRKRQEKIASALPNMVDLLVVCVEAGLGLDMAMSRVGQELHLSSPDLSRELNALGRELSAGQAHEVALNRLAWRIGLEDIENLVSMLIQAERFGTSIAVSLRVFSDAFRTGRQQKVEEAAAKTTIKLLFPLIIFIFPAIFVILLGLAVVNIFTGGL